MICLQRYYDIFRELLSESSQQIYYYKSMNSVGENK